MDLEALEREQRALAARVRLEPAALPSPAELSVFAFDVHYRAGIAHVAGSLWQGGREQVTYCGACEVAAPYLPGLFCYREGPALLALWRSVAERLPAVDVLLVDGHGVAHPRRFGLACWLGLAAERPALGVAKQSLLSDPPEPAPERGAAAPVRLGAEPLGWAVRRRTGVKPVFASPGHLLDVAGAREATLALPGRCRVPDPLRRADRAARARASGAPSAGEVELGRLPPALPPWHDS